MAKRIKPRTSDSTVVVNEKGLATGSGELADGSASNNSDSSEVRSGTVTASGGTGAYTYTLLGSATGAHGTISLNAVTGAYTYTLTSRYDTAPDADNAANTELSRDTFAFQVTDAAGQSSTRTSL